METGIAIASIIGIVDAAKRQFPEISGITTIGISIVLGIVLGFFNFFGVIGIENGLLTGLAASGVCTVAKRIGV